MLLRLDRVVPVVAGAEQAIQSESRRIAGLSTSDGPGLQQAHRHVRVLGQSRGQHAARGSAADDDVIELPLGDLTAPTSGDRELSAGCTFVLRDNLDRLAAVDGRSSRSSPDERHAADEEVRGVLEVPVGVADRVVDVLARPRDVEGHPDRPVDHGERVDEQAPAPEREVPVPRAQASATSPRMRRRSSGPVTQQVGEVEHDDRHRRQGQEPPRSGCRC